MSKKMADAAEDKAKKLQVRIAIAIMDEHGNLKNYVRMLQEKHCSANCEI
jgi:uncharacterized protein GlcG (DUF336 family)